MQLECARTHTSTQMQQRSQSKPSRMIRPCVKVVGSSTIPGKSAVDEVSADTVFGKIDLQLESARLTHQPVGQSSSVILFSNCEEVRLDSRRMEWVTHDWHTTAGLSPWQSTMLRAFL